LARHILHTFVINATTVRFPDKPLVSVCTATYEPGDRIGRAFRSLTGQTYRNWEWVIYDDSRDDGRTFAELCALTHYDARISVHRADRPSGVIGEVKRRAFMLGRGALLVELDHDDELAAGALADVVNAFAAFPDAGFAYSDWAEVDEHGNAVRYPSTWAFGYGGYRSEDYDGRRLEVAIAPAINARTIRHIVSSPNHLRAWRRDAYLAAGGHSAEIHVADDYELLLRTFLSTRLVHIRRLGYIQWHDLAAGTNTQRRRNAEIQRLVRLFRNHYHRAIHDRFTELGIDDFLWRDGDLAWNDSDPEPAPQANYEIP
jgi:glycosyltransferase involved in cell wall biosynthesis